MIASIDVVITNYNRRDLVGRAIQSVLDQTYNDFALWVVDDGSTDGSVDEIRSLCGMDIRCHILPLMHIGRCGTVKNIGAWAGKSRYLTFVDSDDTIEPTALEEVMAAFNEQKVDIVYTDQIVVDGKGGEKPANNTGVVYSQEMMLTMRCIKQLYVIEREIFTKLNGHDPTFLYAADYDLVIRASEIASVYHLQRPLYRYLISQDHEQISNQHKQLQTAFAYRARLAGYLRRKIVPPKEVFLGAKMGQDLG